MPVSASGNILGIVNGFEDLLRAGYTRAMPRFLCAQAKNNSPIVTAFQNGGRVCRAPRAETIAHAIDNPFPPNGDRVMARAGLFALPASCVPLGALRAARASGIVGEGESAVLVATGGGLKYTAAFSAHRLDWIDCLLNDLARLIG